MKDKQVRVGRSDDQLRPLKLSYDVFAYSSGSTLLEIGKTRVLSAVTLQQGVPHFLRGKKAGWLTAEYSLLPASTPTRVLRESVIGKRSGRSIEISRLIGRALRSVMNLERLGEQTIFVDCDVLQADGGTRTACITGAYLALRAAEANWLARGIISKPILVDELAAISVGVVDGLPMLDLDFSEDSSCEADFNFIVTRSDRVIEVQGSAEKCPLSWDHFEDMRSYALSGARQLFSFFDEHPYPSPVSSSERGAGLRSPQL